MFVSIDDYKLPDGNIDWKAYTKAKIDAGEICYQCHSYISAFNNNGERQLCQECKHFSDSGEVRHRKYIRCPSCCHKMSPDEDLYSAYEDGEHEITCDECDYKFTITTHVTYSHESPALIDEEKDHEDSDNSGRR